MKKISLILIVMFTILLGCKKEEGPAGKDGTNGTDGIQGPTGNANVKTKIITVANWTWNSNFYWYESNIIINDITQDIVDNGAVFVYLVVNDDINNPNESGNIALPATYYDNNSSHTFSYNWLLQLVTVRLGWSDKIDHGKPNGSYTYKVVITSGNPITP